MVKEKEIYNYDNEKFLDLIEHYLDNGKDRKNWISRLIIKIKSAYFMKKIMKI